MVVFSTFLKRDEPDSPKYVKNRAEWIRLYRIFDTEFPEPIKEEKIAKCGTYFLDLLIFSEKDKPKLEKLTSNWVYIKNSKIPENLYSKIQNDPYTISGTVKNYIETKEIYVKQTRRKFLRVEDKFKLLVFKVNLNLILV